MRENRAYGERGWGAPRVREDRGRSGKEGGGREGGGQHQGRHGGPGGGCGQAQVNSIQTALANHPLPPQVPLEKRMYPTT